MYELALQATSDPPLCSLSPKLMVQKSMQKLCCKHTSKSLLRLLLEEVLWPYLLPLSWNSLTKAVQTHTGLSRAARRLHIHDISCCAVPGCHAASTSGTGSWGRVAQITASFTALPISPAMLGPGLAVRGHPNKNAAFSSSSCRESTFAAVPRLRSMISCSSSSVLAP